MRSAILIAGMLAGGVAVAGTIESKPLSETWINPGFATVHFDSNLGLNGANKGIGAEYRFSTVASVTAGRMLNSDRKYSNYVGVYYQPWSVGMVRLGAVVGGFDGYPNMRDGGWFPALIPTASIEYQRVGLNVGFIPSYKNRLYGGVSFQLKFKIMD
ncbi:MAG TPA: hypothetical protein VFT37_16035 [Telluria sp.]|nr:hypothetical protein [Telluria sp.]